MIRDTGVRRRDGGDINPWYTNQIKNMAMLMSRKINFKSDNNWLDLEQKASIWRLKLLSRRTEDDKAGKHHGQMASPSQSLIWHCDHMRDTYILLETLWCAGVYPCSFSYTTQYILAAATEIATLHTRFHKNTVYFLSLKKH